MATRHPVKDTRGPENRNGQRGRNRTGTLFAPGFGNIVLCYAFVCSLLLAAAALLFAVNFADTSDRRLYAHYYYLRTTIALMVIGYCIGGLLILMGADYSSSLILAGLAIAASSTVLTFARCLNGTFCALRRVAPPGFKSYLV